MISKLLAVGAVILVTVMLPTLDDNQYIAQKTTTESDSAVVVKLAKPVQKPQQAVEQPKTEQVAQVPSLPEKPTEPAEIKPQPQNTSAPIGCGPHDPKLIYDILIEIGVPRLAAIQQVGSWTTESHLDQCQKRGDGGIAWGLNSWHPGRRADMPEELRQQITWAIHTEMKRDCASCYAQFMAAESVWSVRSAIQKSTRWGVEGGRWNYADQYSQRL